MRPASIAVCLDQRANFPVKINWVLIPKNRLEPQSWWLTINMVQNLKFTAVATVNCGTSALPSLDCSRVVASTKLAVTANDSVQPLHSCQ